MGLGRLNGHIRGGTGRTQFGATQGGKCKVELYRVEVAKLKMQSGTQWRVEVAKCKARIGCKAKQGMRGGSDDRGGHGGGVRVHQVHVMLNLLF